MVAPVLTNAIFSDTTLAETGTLTLTLTFDQTMNTGVNPGIFFPTLGENPSAALMITSQAWLAGATQFRITYSINDQNLDIANVDIRISGAQNSTTSEFMTPTDRLDAFSIDQRISATGTPDLDASSDLGVSSTDDITSDNKPIFRVSLPSNSDGEIKAGDTLKLIDTSNNNAVVGTHIVTMQEASDAVALVDVMTALSVGSHAIRVDVTDTFGNARTGTGALTVQIENNSPVFGFSQGFSSDTAGFFTGNGYGAIQRVASGTNGITAPDGDGFYAIVTDPGADATGPYTRFGGFSSEFVDNSQADVRVYLDTNWAANQSFQYTVAANGTDGNHLRDFGFQVRATGNGTIQVGASNGATQETLTSDVPNATLVTTTGWYTLQHVFHNVGGVLSVDLNLVNAAGVVTTVATLSDPADTIGMNGEVAGTRYGWFTDVSVTGGLAVDAVRLGDFDGRVVEAATAVSTSGAIPFSDVELTDMHTVSVTPAGNNYLGTFTPVLTDSVGDGQGSVAWTFNATSAQLDPLQAGQIVTQVYTLTINDGHGGVASRDITITIVGTNDAAVVAGDTMRNLIETNAVLTTTGTLTSTDVDGTANAFTAATVAGTYGQLVLAANGSYTYTASSAHNEFVAGTTYSDTFNVATADGTAAQVVIAIVGTNDAPVARPVTLPAATEDVVYTFSASQLLAGVTDVDSTVLSITNVSIAFGNGTLVNNNGIYTYTPALNDDGSVVFAYTASDGTLTASSVAVLDITPVIDTPVAKFVSTSADENFTASTDDDRFIFQPGGGHDTVRGFAAGSGTPDKIVLAAYANLHSFSDVLALTSDDGSGNSVINLGHGDTVTLYGVTKSALSADDFVVDYFGQPQVGLPSAFNPANGWMTQNQSPRHLADVNGDGNADVVGFNTNGVYVSLATGDGHFASPVVTLSALNPANGWTSDNQFPRLLGDVNGDHQADIVGFGNGGVYVSLATGGGNFAAPAITLAAFNPTNGWTTQDEFPRQLADVNGDGQADIVGFGNGGVYVSLATGGGNFSAPTITLAAFNPANGWTSQDQFPRLLADVNGDHMADIVGFGNGGVYVSLATGNGNFAAPSIVLPGFNPANGWTSQNQFERQVADINGDGMADIVGFGNGGIHIALATGGGHFNDKIIDASAFDAANGWTSDNQFHREVADVNHDGVADVVGFGNPGVLVSLNHEYLV